jgi:hypothetical protein
MAHGWLVTVTIEFTKDEAFLLVRNRRQTFESSVVQVTFCPHLRLAQWLVELYGSVCGPPSGLTYCSGDLTFTGNDRGAGKCSTAANLYLLSLNLTLTVQKSGSTISISDQISGDCTTQSVDGEQKTRQLHSSCAGFCHHATKKKNTVFGDFFLEWVPMIYMISLQHSPPPSIIPIPRFAPAYWSQKRI